MRIQLQRLRRFLQLATAQTRTVTIDQGLDRGGDNTGFRPTELWLIGLSACSVTTMTRYVEDKGWSVDDIHVTAEDTMNEQGDISRIEFQVTIKGQITEKQKSELLTHVRKNCKLLRTVSSHIEIEYIEATGEVEAAPAVCHLADGSCCS
ncbi:OsmC family protein [Paenibacillus sp. UNC451MF]|uniref:OsmC family protein n=1 Tax=Paenibacillus sp. UNC451MF TaxID=1449063 RepID=UPI000491730B|nr:OsmC family protein [Paenibacillus sp. UNC451MF]